MKILGFFVAGLFCGLIAKHRLKVTPELHQEISDIKKELQNECNPLILLVPGAESNIDNN
jgi:hypothetical protein